MLVNPAARGRAPRRAVADAVARLVAAGIEAVVVGGVHAADSARMLRGALDEGVDAVVSAGGDGTVHIALQELSGTAVPLAVLPVGTGNDFAAALGIRSVDQALRLILTGRTRAVDVARVDRAGLPSVLFGTILAAGFDSRVNDRANRMRHPRGQARYTLALLAEFTRLHSEPFRVTWTDADGRRHEIADDLVLAAVANGRSYGGGIPIAPDADVADGLLDLVVVRDVSRRRMLRFLPSAYRGTHWRIREVSMQRARMVRIEADGVTGYADGDAVGPLPLTVSVLPGVLRVFSD
ncbi:YegS/Rv2252/BmrU family lipid kinase [Microbacterium mangrovi]|uniref:YegS/Rv2252/BmrU family lipid kinase n=1 Tax=Microbacterium mangrovi TaxID=1348253 RepID=UPI0022B1D9A5|nr:YegS/Rv2252/BmrU family lipid kinase [Microbacterium mangrovi]